MIETTNYVPIQEINGRESNNWPKETFELNSHWNNPGYIVLYFEEADIRITVSAKDLKTAIENATNINRY